jgi:hypothetical protein
MFLAILVWFMECCLRRRIKEREWAENWRAGVEGLNVRESEEILMQ